MMATGLVNLFISSLKVPIWCIKTREDLFLPHTFKIALSYEALKPAIDL
jgi:hypothetical protein